MNGDAYICEKGHLHVEFDPEGDLGPADLVRFRGGRCVLERSEAGTYHIIVSAPGDEEVTH